MPLSTTARPRRFLLRLILAAALLTAVAVHVRFWYGPRERAGIPEGIAGRVLAADKFPIRLWLAYPHQNLGALERAIPDFEAWLGAVGRLAGLPEPRIPAFGPFRMPPSNGLAIATDAAGQQFVAAAEVYPVIAVLARLAGKLASNPWLAGGQVEIEGGTATVGWEGVRGWWVVSAGATLPDPASTGAGATRSPAIAFATTRGVELLPEGTIRVARQGGSLEAGLEGSAPPASLMIESLPAAERPILAMVAPAGFGKGGQGGLVLWANAGGGLPGVAVLNGPGGRWELPGESLLSLAGGGAAGTVVAGLEIRAYDSGTAGRTAALVPLLRPGSAPGEIAAVDAWIDPGPAAREVRRVKELLTAIPLFGSREVQRWRDLDAALGPLTGRGPITLHLALAPPALRLRFSASMQPPAAR